ncbi:hypothetical protein IFR05_016371 [Cadophora sp. M221]|nr:hypothetical protein IFR05_016371 [Cadophora sp. M221]
MAKAVKAKAEKKFPKLERPLSKPTKLVVDIEAYVNRPAEERRKEVEAGKSPGKIKRPMNSFMLYRKDYQRQAKDWCLKNSHQIVSQVCGESWWLEPDHIKKQYREWAQLERINHLKAHLEYKFSPSKPGASKASKRKVSEVAITEEYSLDAYESQDGPKRGSKKYRPSLTMIQHPVVYPTTESAYQYTTGDNTIEPVQNLHSFSHPAFQNGTDPMMSHDQQPFSGNNMLDHGLPSTYYDGSHHVGHYQEDSFAADNQDYMLFIDPALKCFQIQDLSAHSVRGGEEQWYGRGLVEEDVSRGVSQCQPF